MGAVWALTMLPDGRLASGSDDNRSGCGIWKLGLRVHSVWRWTPLYSASSLVPMEVSSPATKWSGCTGWKSHELLRSMAWQSG